MSRTGIRPAQCRRPLVRPLAIMVVATIATLSGASGLHALFTASATGSVQVTVGVPAIPRPATVGCETVGSLLSRRARFTWTHPAGQPQPSEYVIRVRDGAEEREIVRVPGTTTEYEVTTGLLVGALAWLLELLLGGGTRPVTVNAVYVSDSGAVFESPSSWDHHLHAALGLASGIGCSPGESR